MMEEVVVETASRMNDEFTHNQSCTVRNMVILTECMQSTTETVSGAPGEAFSHNLVYSPQLLSVSFMTVGQKFNA
jgi:hypothetical protein